MALHGWTVALDDGAGNVTARVPVSGGVASFPIPENGTISPVFHNLVRSPADPPGGFHWHTDDTVVTILVGDASIGCGCMPLPPTIVVLPEVEIEQ